jgi:hypothetical protein
MPTLQQSFRRIALATALCGLWPAAAQADLIHIKGDPGLNGLGFFKGTIAYSDTDPGHATLTVMLTNTSPAANGGFLTGFVFNNPGDKITGVTLTGPAKFELLGGPKFNNNAINGAPFGHFDIGAAVGGSFEGGGNPNPGLGVGQTGTFVFSLTGKGLDGLSALSFEKELSVGPGNGEGDKPFVARFRGFKNGGSDKVPDAVVHETPEPGTLALTGATLCGLAGYGWARRRRQV